jgi:hypothetical protein
MSILSWNKLVLVCALAMLTLCISCVENLDELPPEKSKLVIYGEISDRAERISVRVYRTTGYGVPFEAISDAQVIIYKDDNIASQLSGDRYGFYYSQWPGAKRGSTYYLKVQLTDGQTYVSSKEIVPSNGGIVEALRYEKTPTTYTFYTDFEDTDSGLNFYRMRYLGFYNKGGTPINVASYVYVDNLPDNLKECYASTLQKITSPHWYKDLDLEQLTLENDLLFNGEKVTNYKIAEVAKNSKFGLGYIFNFRLHTINKNNYIYWNAIANQLDNTGSIFETANYNIRGNIFSVENPDEEVQGYFEVSSTSEINILFPIETGVPEQVCKP